MAHDLLRHPLHPSAFHTDACHFHQHHQVLLEYLSRFLYFIWFQQHKICTQQEQQSCEVHLLENTPTFSTGDLTSKIGQTDTVYSVRLRPMTHLQFSRTILSREFSCATKLQVWRGESHEFLTVAQLYFAIELCSILCNSVDRMLNADWSVVIVVFVLLLFAVHIRLFA